MSTADQAFITPAVFLWAIERARSTPEKLAKKLKTRTGSVVSWGEGKARPTFSQAQRLADALYVPFGYLFLPDPPDEHLPLTDFRTVPGKRISPSADLIDTVNDALFKQEWYREFLLQQGGERLPFVGSFSERNDSKAIAESIRTTIGLDATLRQRCKSWNQLFVSLVRQVEAAGILVMRTGVAAGNSRRKLSVKEFRGFALSDTLAPVIFINGKDWPKAQLFTIAHELVHIWIGNSGISNESLKGLDAPNTIEWLCNETAAELLVPESEFRALWNNGEETSANVDEVVRHFKVSRLVALRRAFDLEKISREEYFLQYRFEEKAFDENERRSGGSFYNNVLARNSSTLATTVVRAATKELCFIAMPVAC